MMEWLRKLRGKRPAPLAGAPPARRRKTYSARSGYVYLYRFEGYRQTARGSGESTEFVFEVSADRKTFQPVSVFIAGSATAAWEDEHHRLNSNERYAIAKMALFQAFDEREEPRLLRQPVIVRRADAESILDTLGIG
jgi:hypothetical protein